MVVVMSMMRRQLGLVDLAIELQDGQRVRVDRGAAALFDAVVSAVVEEYVLVGDVQGHVERERLGKRLEELLFGV